MGGKNWVGEAVQRKEDLRYITGHGKYTDDVKLPGMLHAAMLRSPYAHARIKAIDCSRARLLEGVHAVITGEEAKKYWGPLAPAININMKVPTVYGLAVDKVYYVGEPVVAVAAESRYIAEDALELIEVEYEPLDPVVSAEKALEEGSALLYPEWGDNIQCHAESKVGAVEEVFNEADYVFEERLPMHRYTGVPMEGRAALADFDPFNRKLTIWLSSQAPNQAKTLFAQTFNLPEQDVRVITLDVGGAFGNKLQVNGEVIPAMLSMAAGKPVKWTETVQESLLSGAHGRDYVWYLKVAVQKDGTLLGLQAKLIGDVGCDGTCHNAGAGKYLVAAGYVPGPYKWKAYQVETIVAVTNKSPSGAYRGYGKDMGCYPMERMLDMIAKKLDISPVELRKRNFIRPEEFPYKQISGPIYDSGQYEESLNQVLSLIKYDEIKERQKRENGKGGKYIGIGIGSMVEPSGGSVPNCIFNSYEVATIRLVPGGGFLVLTGHQNLGQGIETTLAQVAANELHCRPEDVRIIYGDTDAVPYGLGPWSSRGSTFTVSCVVEAARKLKGNMLRIAAHLLQCSETDLDVSESRIYSTSNRDLSISFTELGNKVHLWPGALGAVPREMTDFVEATYFWRSPNAYWIPDEQGRVGLYTTHSSASSAVVLEVDAYTGKINLLTYATCFDCGTVINPEVLRGQIHGGSVQGLGGILWEELHYDENGQLLNTDLTSYLHPLAADLPEILVAHTVSPSPYTSLGSKGMGEGPPMLPPVVVANALEDALKSFEIKVAETPLTPERVFNLIQQRAGTGELHA